MLKELLENENKYYKELSKSQEEEIDILRKEIERLNDIIDNLEKGESKNPKCCICGKICENEFGNNPYPVKEKGRCCDVCNITEVVPARIEMLKEDKNNE